MSECCSSSSCESSQATRIPRKHTCPANGKTYAAVNPATISHHLKHPWNWQAIQQGYYFCDDSNCDVVYFAEDNSVIKTDALRTEVGIKARKPESLLCYCYGVTFNDAKNQPGIKSFVLNKTKARECACDTRNPSGRCCLKDFPRDSGPVSPSK